MIDSIHSREVNTIIAESEPVIVNPEEMSRDVADPEILTNEGISLEGLEVRPVAVENKIENDTLEVETAQGDKVENVSKPVVEPEVVNLVTAPAPNASGANIEKNAHKLIEKSYGLPDNRVNVGELNILHNAVRVKVESFEKN